MKKGVKIIGIILLLISMGWASNWDLPKEDRSAEYVEALERYEAERGRTYKVIIDGDVYEGAYIDGMWYEALEIYGGAIPEEFMENSDDE